MGSIGQVNCIQDNRVNVTIKLDEEPYLDLVRSNIENTTEEYFSLPTST